MMFSRILLRVKWFCLILGFIIGTSIGCLCVTLRHLHCTDIESMTRSSLDPELGFAQQDDFLPANESFLGRFPYYSDNTTVADNLQESIRVLCWVWCSGRDIQNQTLAIRKTWGRKCNTVLIFTDKQFTNVSSIDLSKADVDYSTSRYIMAYRYVYKYYRDHADWFFGTFEETYVCVENLRMFLSQKDTSKAFYFGHRLQLQDKTLEFVDARVGCVLSKEAVRLLGTSGLQKQSCNQMSPAGEKQLGACLNNLGVKIGTTTDIFGKTRFLSFAPSIQMQGTQSRWFLQQDQEGLGKGVNSISKYAITLSGMTSFFMYGIEYYLYYMKVVGIFPIDQDFNPTDEQRNRK